MSVKVLVCIADGIEELESVTVIDVLRRAQADVTVASVNGQTVTASREVKLVADKLIKDCLDEEFDLVVLPGGKTGAENLRNNPELDKILANQKQQGRLYAAICASPAVTFVPKGLLDGKKATCYPALKENLDNWVEQAVIVDGNCITSQGPGTAIEFALKLTELLFDKSKADQVAEAMLVKR
jgi:4-methyl-5(b-hydroxyethyl)-thiazole monophosphate biosynthesis